MRLSVWWEQVLGTPSREDIQSMNPNYTEFQFPQIKAHPWSKVFSKRLPPDAVDLVRTQTPAPCVSACAQAYSLLCALTHALFLPHSSQRSIAT